MDKIASAWTIFQKEQPFSIHIEHIETELSSLSGVKYILDMIFCNNNEYICTSNNLSKTTNIEEISFIYLYNLNDFFNSHLSATKPISVSEVIHPNFSLHGPKAKTIPKM